MKIHKVAPQVLESAVVLLQSMAPELTPTRLVAALKKFEIDEPAQSSNTSERPMTIKEACALLQVTRHTLYKYVKSGQIRATRLGGHRLFRVDPVSIREFLNMEPAKEA